jgi:hypothetical protein
VRYRLMLVASIAIGIILVIASALFALVER